MSRKLSTSSNSPLSVCEPAQIPRQWRWLTWVMSGLVLTSCLRDLEGRPCPCELGYTCCEGRCQSSATCDENNPSAPMSTCGSECTSGIDAGSSAVVVDASVEPSTPGHDSSLDAFTSEGFGDASASDSDVASDAAVSSNEGEVVSTEADASLPDGETSPDARADTGSTTESSMSMADSSAVSTEVDASADTCGDGVRQSPEACDDGNRIAGDGCSASCQPSRLAVALYHVCVVSDSGRLRCWGQNVLGQLGLGDTITRGATPDSSFELLPLLDIGPRTVTSITVGADHTCALFNDDAVGCWGNNSSGQLGIDDVEARGDDALEMGAALQTVVLPGLQYSPATRVVGTGAATCILDANHQVWCFGYGRFLGYDQENVGDSPGEMASLVPLDLGDFQVQGLFAGGSHACAISTAGDVKCWGGNQYGQLGLPDLLDRGIARDELGDALPRVDLGEGRVARDLALGNSHTCALLDDASVKCWGENQGGQLGLGVNDRWLTNVDLPALDLGVGRTATAVAAGGNHTCVVLDNNQVKCFGSLNAEHPVYGVNVGDESFEVGDDAPASNFGSTRRVLEIGLGYSYACARLEGEVLRCWGRNHDGQLGLGDPSLSTELVVEDPEGLRDFSLEF